MTSYHGLFRKQYGTHSENWRRPHSSAYKDRGIRGGDVVAFRSPHYRILTVHRVVKLDPRGVSTKGDNNLTIDAWILHPSDIIGRVDSVKEGGIK